MALALIDVEKPEVWVSVLLGIGQKEAFIGSSYFQVFILVYFSPELTTENTVSDKKGYKRKRHAISPLTQPCRKHCLSTAAVNSTEAPNRNSSPPS